MHDFRMGLTHCASLLCDRSHLKGEGVEPQQHAAHKDAQRTPRLKQDGLLIQDLARGPTRAQQLWGQRGNRNQ
jgi:hypothetical protein